MFHDRLRLSTVLICGHLRMFAEQCGTLRNATRKPRRSAEFIGFSTSARCAGKAGERYDCVHSDGCVRRCREPELESASSERTWPVTSHGETLGVFVPVGARPRPAKPPRATKPTKADIEAVRRAGAEMAAMIAAIGTTPEELIADFDTARREKRASRART